MATNDIPSPGVFFGFEVGADGCLARWDRVVEYFRLLGGCSDRVSVVELGLSTLGNPFLLVYISSPDNLKNLERYREISHKLADPRGLSDEEIQSGLSTLKAVDHRLQRIDAGGKIILDDEKAKTLSSEKVKKTNQILGMFMMASMKKG